MTTCQACRDGAAQCAVPSRSDGHTFELCHRCRECLDARVLSPEQWLNLASAHTGQVFELQSDFYGVHGDRFDDDAPEPWRVRDFRSNLPRLFDVAIAWSGELADCDDGELVKLINRFPPAQLKAEFDRRLASSTNPKVVWALLRGAGSGLLSASDATEFARQFASSAGEHELFDWVGLAVRRLPWAFVKERFLEVVRAIAIDKRRFELVTLNKLAAGAERAQRRALMAEFLPMLPPDRVGESLAMYLNLVNANDRPSLVTELLADKVLSSLVTDHQEPAGSSREQSQYWAWGQIAAGCDSDWSVRFFGHERGNWPIVCAAAAVALGRCADQVYPGVTDALKPIAGLANRWQRVEAELKSAARWIEP